MLISSSPLQEENSCVYKISVVITVIVEFLNQHTVMFKYILFSATNSSTESAFNQPLLHLPLSSPMSFGIAPPIHHMHPQSNLNQIKPGLFPEASIYSVHQPLTQHPSQFPL